jgi:hypothetical protein
MLRRPFCRRYGHIAALALAYVSTLALTARAADSFDPMTQVGPNPVLPEPPALPFSADAHYPGSIYPRPTGDSHRGASREDISGYAAGLIDASGKAMIRGSR